MGYSFSPELAAVLREANREFDLTLRMDYDHNASNLLRRSDQWPFLQARCSGRVSAHGFASGVSHDCRSPGQSRFRKIERIARLVYQASWDLAQK
jgi:hypothetical protein